MVVKREDQRTPLSNWYSWCDVQQTHYRTSKTARPQKQVKNKQFFISSKKEKWQALNFRIENYKIGENWGFS